MGDQSKENALLETANGSQTLSQVKGPDWLTTDVMVFLHCSITALTDETTSVGSIRENAGNPKTVDGDSVIDKSLM